MSLKLSIEPISNSDHTLRRFMYSDEIYYDVGLEIDFQH